MRCSRYRKSNQAADYPVNRFRNYAAYKSELIGPHPFFCVCLSPYSIHHSLIKPPSTTWFCANNYFPKTPSILTFNGCRNSNDYDYFTHIRVSDAVASRSFVWFSSLIAHVNVVCRFLGNKRYWKIVLSIAFTMNRFIELLRNIWRRITLNKISRMDANTNRNLIKWGYLLQPLQSGGEYVGEHYLTANFNISSLGYSLFSILWEYV